MSKTFKKAFVGYTKQRGTDSLQVAVCSALTQNRTAKGSSPAPRP